MIIIHAVMQIDSTKQQSFLEEIETLIRASRQESGNISYNLYKDIEKNHTFTMVEVWQDAAAVESHNTSEHFTSFVAKASNFLVAPLDIKAYDGHPLQS
ncbi:antibiotic biosynthesis monooxygenase [Niallia circulans]|jgi:quinol monooxygenase YgiN|uniref:putative quinol monooxygenase n=1 Tax=Niallia TaxID=2837506 RepID=UPI00077C7AC1|nr:putative quinol monooxygenase [Niallia circulans]MCM2983403.1 antibiotic biosynthesis monooxygenase [Niallia circulans]MDR4318064.1 antibiotic biosynthesis monooxygenase [Niallia circulans]MED3838579.1 putative quinol monooxygenase [Niallia circulans]MED4244533.1 putative quinol monooxygenase [Niallia circulans]MED4249454.1 putative quinol monooxygenase [Niallia circulans]